MCRAWSTWRRCGRRSATSAETPAASTRWRRAELVIDHSVIADVFARTDAFQINTDIEYGRNRGALPVPALGPDRVRRVQGRATGHGIVHQVNIEYLARVVMVRGGVAYPDTVVGTDSHTTMVNGLGVLGWGVGGIEAEAAMLGQPVSMLIPRVVGFKLSGELPQGATATDLVLTITEQLRKHGVVGKFVEFYGEGVGAVPLANRATIGNMSPEYGSTCAIFPIDAETLRYLRFTGRDESQVALVEAYAKAQGLWHDPSAEPVYSEYLGLDLSTVVPSIAGRSAPGPGVPDRRRGSAFREVLPTYTSSDHRRRLGDGAGRHDVRPAARRRRHRVDHLLHQHLEPLGDGGRGAAREEGRRARPGEPAMGEDDAGPGVEGRHRLLRRSGLDRLLEKLGFDLVGYGCVTCIGNSGPLPEEVSKAVNASDLAVVSVLSGNRNFEAGSSRT